MSGGFTPDWLAARDSYDVAALDRETISRLRAWAALQPTDRPLCVVDLGCGTGAGLRRTLEWLTGRAVRAYAVDRDPSLLARLHDGEPTGGLARAGDVCGSVLSGGQVRVTPIVADVLEPLHPAGGPPDGTVDLVVSHAVADLLPLDRFAGRVAALLRPGGYAHLTLTYDGETTFSPTDDPVLDRRVIEAYHRHMNLTRERDPAYGGSTAGHRLAQALATAGLMVVRAAPSVWDVPADDGPLGRAVLEGLIGFIIGSLAELGDPPSDEVARWRDARLAALGTGELRVRVRHLDVLAGLPGPRSSSPSPGS